MKLTAIGGNVKSVEQELYEAASELLEFIRQKFPNDFKEGGRGFTCPFHQALHAAVLRAERKAGGE